MRRELHLLRSLVVSVRASYKYIHTHQIVLMQSKIASNQRCVAAIGMVHISVLLQFTCSCGRGVVVGAFVLLVELDVFIGTGDVTLVFSAHVRFNVSHR